MSWSLVAGFSYGLAALAFALLAALLLRGGWRQRGHAGAFGAACVATATWAALAAAGSAWRAGLLAAMDGLEALRTTAWLALLLVLSGGGARRRGWLAAVGVLAVLAWLAAADGRALAAIVIRLGLAVLGMLLVEHLYRGTPPSSRWGIKFACLGAGALFAYDFYLYSEALLFHRVNDEIWAARGAVNALSVPLLALAVARNPVWTAGLSLSRQIMFGSAALLGSALYLMAMAASAWYLRYIGGVWGTLMQLACLFGAALLLSGVLFSGTVRSRLKVFISKHFYQGRYDYRREWQRFTHALAEDSAALPQRAIQAVAELVESPAGLLWLRREGADFQAVARWNMPLPQAVEAADGALCTFLAARGWVIDVAEWRDHPQRYGLAALPSWLVDADALRLVVPLMLERSLYGYICLAPPRARLLLNWEVCDVLKIAGRQAASYLAHQASANSLAVARQFESFNRMSTFVVHDLKNLVSQLSLLLVNAERHQANPAFQEDMLETLAHTLSKMKSLLLKLRRDEVAEQAAPLQLETLLEQLMRGYAQLEPRPALELCADGLVVLANRQRLERVIGHLILNAVEATPRNGRVAMRLLRGDAAAVIELSDTGHGMSEQFIRERLFQPFESTKRAGMGIGVFESREYAREIGGRLEVSSVPSRGTTFRLVLPLHVDAAAA
ncbi:XrtA/PEP-CTERM system histidine kinase PrsK [Duganella violaceipulchra]|uniref:histidine kinase n=1 Tax=Duganella violaceipulchra TaxID=2849652 RepID=A0AA41HDM1_9BURK|nr:XrtA/PEP-CTERM system histidine kinase PrsK [Duganella violaceicalia]MBV6321878.1 PEP-CTERM system histidine kinase PrsK [Duganella violaceicalia]MCP2007128.1 putative PEP-CTERM system histidine kinase [Duganella violaceicalia]